MFELRWKETEKQILDNAGSCYGVERERTLQYRQLGQVVEWHGKAGGIRRQEWSEWQDVPVSRYGD